MDLRRWRGAAVTVDDEGRLVGVEAAVDKDCGAAMPEIAAGADRLARAHPRRSREDRFWAPEPGTTTITITITITGIVAAPSAAAACVAPDA
ncbi:MAG: hypothetical protein M3Y71_09695 [Actinomycetota bacterium]|nr:hypothetical protein [Actinomycetota bacterium]